MGRSLRQERSIPVRFLSTLACISRTRCARLGVKHIYKQVDLSTAGSQLNSGTIKGMLIYVAGGETPAPWIAEASLAVDWAPLNPSPDELAKLKAAGFAIEEVDPAKFHKKEPG